MSEETTTTQAAVSDKALVKIALGAIGVFLVIAFAKSAITPTSPEDTEKANAKRAIEYCWSTQERKDLDPSAARFAATACYHMEDAYKAKYEH
jgi:hypothetical protein